MVEPWSQAWPLHADLHQSYKGVLADQCPCKSHPKCDMRGPYPYSVPIIHKIKQLKTREMAPWLRVCNALL